MLGKSYDVWIGWVLLWRDNLELRIALQTLRVANIGDSGFVVVRDSAVVARSEPMVRRFNFPYQIGTEGDDPALAEVRTSSVLYMKSKVTRVACLQILVCTAHFYSPLLIPIICLDSDTSQAPNVASFLSS